MQKKGRISKWYYWPMLYMQKGLRDALRRFWSFSDSLRLSTSGKVTLLAVCGIATAFIVVGILSFNVRVPTVSADNVTTSVTVLNTPPVWTVDAQESTESSATTPTNAGAVITWIATGTDGNNDNYWLLICKTGSAATANVGAAPSCNGGVGNQWAVSGVTTSALQASAATTTKETFPFNNESNAWYAFICDGNAALPQCNLTAKQGSGVTASPFVVNHPPVFSAIVNSSPVIPGAAITWTATAHDNDVIRGSDTVQLFVCKANDFNGTGCGAGGSWATSTLAASNPATSTTIVIPTQDKSYNAYVFVTDQNHLAATSTIQGTNSSYTVSNVAPVVTAGTISLVDPVNSSSTLVLINPNSTSGPFWLKNVQVTDNNSCLNSSSGNEISSLEAAVYRSGVGSTSCRLNVSGDYNANNCYPSASPLTNFSCTQDAGSCSGATDSTATFTCTFSLWYNADPTDSGTPWAAQNWLATVRATDDNGATSTITEATTGTDLSSLLAFAVTESTIAFGGLQPGQQNDPLATTTTIKAIGNVGLDESLYGSTMCTNWSALGGGSNPDACDTIGVDPTRQIPIINQKAATTTLTYAAAFSITGSTTPTYLGVHVLKTTATSSPQSKFTYWGIKIPSAITLAGDYTGQNTITAITASSSNW